jgi:hypothetical protein
VVDCFSACPSDDSGACAKRCFAANAKGASEFAARLTCRFYFCATGTTCFPPDDPALPSIACDTENCGELRSACWLVPECYAITLCAGDCGGSSTCIEACKNAASPAAKAAFETWNACQLAQCLG